MTCSARSFQRAAVATDEAILQIFNPDPGYHGQKISQTNFPEIFFGQSMREQQRQARNHLHGLPASSRQ